MIEQVAPLGDVDCRIVWDEAHRSTLSVGLTSHDVQLLGSLVYALPGMHSASPAIPPTPSHLEAQLGQHSESQSKSQSVKRTESVSTVLVEGHATEVTESARRLASTVAQRYGRPVFVSTSIAADVGLIRRVLDLLVDLGLTPPEF